MGNYKNLDLNPYCSWVLTLNGKTFDGGERGSLLSDEELDAYLFSRLKDFNIKEGAVFYSLPTPFEESNKIVKGIKEDIDKVKRKLRTSETVSKAKILSEEEDLTDDDFYYVPNSCGATRAITELPLFNMAPLIPPMSVSAWRDQKIGDLLGGKKLKTVSDKNLQDWIPTTGDEAERKKAVEKLVKLEEESWPELTDIGTKVHQVFEDIFNGNEPKNDGLSDEVFNSVVSQVKSFKASLDAKYPGCSYYPEFLIKSKWDTLSPDTQAVLKSAGVDSISGIIDLLVIDSNGVGHIYDYKVSRKGIAQEGVDDDTYQAAWNAQDNDTLRTYHLWSSAKKNAAGYQTEIYKHICEQHGLIIKDCNIVPIKLDLEYEDPLNPFAITKVKGVTVPPLSRLIIDPARKKKNKIDSLFKKAASQTYEETESMSLIYSSWFPLQGWAQARENEKLSVDYYKQHSNYVQKISKSDRNYKAGEKEYIVKFPGLGKVLYCSEANLDATLSDCISTQKDRQSAKYLDFANAIQSVIGGESIEVLSGQVNTSERNFIRSAFSKYLDGTWQLVSDDATNSLGILVFRKGGKSEVVCLSTDGLRIPTKLAVGTSILGQTKSDKYINSRETLPAIHGNLTLMKGMLYVGQHSDAFTDYPISTIKAVNPWHGIEHSVSNSELLNNYKELIKEHPSSGAKFIKDDLFMSDVDSIVDQAEEYIGSLNLDKQSEDYGTMEWFQRAISKFEITYSDALNMRQGYQNTPEWNALVKLREGLLLARGFRGHIEQDKEDFLTSTKFWELNGLMISSPQYSSSANIRELGQAIDEYAKEVRRQIYTIGAPIQQSFIKVYNKYGTGAKVFDTWFADKENLILKDPDNAEFDGDPITREALTIFLDTMCKLRHPEYSEERRKRAKYEDEDYFAIPLLEAKFSRQVKGLGIFKALKNKLKEKLTVTENLFMGDEDDIAGYENISDYVSANQEVYNKLKYDNMAARSERLKRYGHKMCETDLELVMNAMLTAFCRSNVSKDYIPVIAALKTSLDRADALGGTEARNMNNIRARFNDIVKSKLYGESIVRKELQPLLRWLNLIRSGFTTLTLSLNSRSMFRESLQGIYAGISRAGVKMYPGIDEKHYIQGLTYVIQEAHKNFSGVSLLQQMNAVYGMANQSLSQIENQRRVNWGHINHWGKDTLFITASAPDFMHRMGLLVAKMKADGCFEAHTIGEDGTLIYDWKKDKRFEHFAKGETSHPDYLKEKSLYMSMIDDFNTAGFRNKDGKMLSAENLDDLPQAYTRTEGQSIKNYADLLYGHYDEESKSLLYDTFIGSIALQFKTYLTSKLEQWTMHEGVYNVATLKQQYDAEGNEMYVKFYLDDQGKAHKDVLLKNEYDALSDEDKSKCRLYYEYEGLPMQGMLQESFKVYKSLITMDTETLKKLWDDPTTRAMFMLQMHDLWWMAFLTVLATFIFGSAEDVDHPLNPTEVYKAVKKSGPIENYAYNIITGSMSDSQLGNILGSFTDKPPMISALNKFATTSMQVITGDASIAYWLTRNVGMISDFQGMAETYNQYK